MAAGVGNNNHVGGPGSRFGGVDRPAGLGGIGGNDSRFGNTRYDQSSIATRPATFGNIAGAFGTALGFGPATAAGLIGGIDPYSGPAGRTTGFSYDGKNMALQGGGFGGMPGQGNSQQQMVMQKLLAMNPAWAKVLQRGMAPSPMQAQAATAAAPATPAAPKPMGYASQMFLSPGGAQNYGVMRPGYSFFGPGGM